MDAAANLPWPAEQAARTRASAVEEILGALVSLGLAHKQRGGTYSVGGQRAGFRVQHETGRLGDACLGRSLGRLGYAKLSTSLSAAPLLNVNA